jgi:competence protein ComEA
MSILTSERARELLARVGLAELSPTALRGVLIAAVIVIALGLWRFWPSAPEPEIAFDEGVGTVTADAEAIVAEEPPADIVVHVAGAVFRPGVYELPAGSRVADAVAAAGGVVGTAAPDAVNLARLLVDGEQIYLPTVEEIESGTVTGPATAGSLGAGSTASGLVNINTAGTAELETLPGIGPATAQAIVEDREANGPFLTPEDLMRVSGIGPKKFDAVKDLVTTG